MIIQPLSDPFLVYRFCQLVRERAGAEIAFFTSSQNTTIIKLTLRNPVSLLDILGNMEEVDECSQEASAKNLPPLLNAEGERALWVTLKAG